MAAVFSSIFKSEISAAFLSQHIKRTITKQTVKIIRVISLVAWKEFTVSVAKKPVVFKISLHCLLPALLF